MLQLALRSQLYCLPLAKVARAWLVSSRLRAPLPSKASLLVPKLRYAKYGYRSGVLYVLHNPVQNYASTSTAFVSRSSPDSRFEGYQNLPRKRITSAPCASVRLEVYYLRNQKESSFARTPLLAQFSFSFYLEQKTKMLPPR